MKHTVDTPLRSSRWFATDDLAGLIHRSSLRAEGISRTALDGRPVVGICNSWSELVSCNLHFRGLAEAVKRGVLQAGGLPLEFPTISLGENLMKPTAMLYRNLMSMDVEVSIRAYPLDAVVLLAGCDKTIPAQLMGAASAGVPALMLTGGPATPGRYRGRPLSSGADLWHYTEEYRAGRLDERQLADIEAALSPSAGHCTELGTASTMSCVVEALGMSLAGSAAIPAMDARRFAAAEDAGRAAVQLALRGPTPAEVLRPEAFANAITVLMSLGGSTNAVIHLLAIAGRVGVPLSLADFARISKRTPVLANLKPSGDYLMEDFYNAGGVPALMERLSDRLSMNVITVDGTKLGSRIESRSSIDTVLAPSDAPRSSTGGIAILHGSLAPRGAVIKRSAASPRLLRHRGRAVVFNDVRDLSKRIDDPDLDVDGDSVLVLKNAGPKGGPGMPEWGQLPIPATLLRRGITDLVRVSDARMSGTAYGTVVLHVAPESAANGPLAVVEDGDWITLDVDEGRLDLEIPESELANRLSVKTERKLDHCRGYLRLYLEHVLQADEGCDFDFLRRVTEATDEDDDYLSTGWLAGW